MGEHASIPGTSIGVMCNVLPAGILLPKHVPSFTAVLYGRVAQGFPMEKLLSRTGQPAQTSWVAAVGCSPNRKNNSTGPSTTRPVSSANVPSSGPTTAEATPGRSPRPRGPRSPPLAARSSSTPADSSSLAEMLPRVARASRIGPSFCGDFTTVWSHPKGPGQASGPPSWRWPEGMIANDRPIIPERWTGHGSPRRHLVGNGAR